MEKTELIKLLKSPLIPDDVEVYFCDGNIYRKVDDVRLQHYPGGSKQMAVLRPLEDMFINQEREHERSNADRVVS